MITDTLVQLGIDQVGISDILSRMSEPHRAYHTVDHVRDILYNLRVVCTSGSEMERYMIAAAWFHDIVYQISSKTNERDSADYSRQYIMKEVDPDILAGIIMATQHHEPQTVMEEVFCDLDMMILASEWELYQAYSRNIRQEYHEVSDHDYTKGRINFLTRCLENPIFHTMPQYERKARDNIGRERDILKWLVDSTP